MKVLKKLSFILVVVPLFFGLFLTFSQETFAQTTNCSSGVTISGPGTAIKKLGSSTKFTLQINNLSPQANCTYAPFVSDGSNVSGWDFKFATSTTATPQKTLSLTVPSQGSKTLVVTATPPSSWINNPTKNEFRLRLKFNGNQVPTFKDISYPATYACNLAPKLTTSSAVGTGSNTSRTYSLKLNNPEESGCPASKYTLSASTPNNSTWKTEFQNSSGAKLDSLSITRSPGQELNFKLKVTAPSGASAGSKNVRVSATSEARKSGSIDLTYRVTENSGGDGGGTTAGCVAPKLEVSPLTREGKPGVEKQYTIKVTNQDSGSCADSTEFTLERDLPGDKDTSWKGKFENNKLTIAKGKSKETTLFVTSPTTATEGIKTIIVSVKRANGKNTSRNDIKYKVLPKSEPTKAPTKKPTTPPTKPPTSEPTKAPTKKPTTGPTPSSCERNTPDLTVTPASRSGKPGDEVSYTIKVKNNDEGPCDVRKLTLQRTLPSTGWGGTWSADNSDFNIAKNVEKTFTLKVKAPAAASVGSKNITITLKNSNDLTLATKTTTFVVENITNPPDPEDEYTRLNFVVGVDGIGTTPRIPLGGNKNPDNITRYLDFKLYNAATNTLTHQIYAPYPFNYNPDSEKFEATYDIVSSMLPDGTYNIFFEGPPFLNTQYPGSITVKKGQTTNLNSPNFYMITGNINNLDQSTNKIDILDYNVLISCSIFSKSTTLCDSNGNYSNWSDLNDDGIVDQSDYTLWLKEFANQQGAQLPN